MSNDLLSNHAEVERILNLKYWSYLGGSDLSEDDQQKFEIIHFMRNYFNKEANKVRSLSQIYSSSFYTDDYGNNWVLLPSFMNKYHMPDDEYTFKVGLGLAKPWSRKFVRFDNKRWGGEFELIVKGSGEVLNSSSGAFGQFLGTYNYGQTLASPLKHKFLDINPHFELQHKESNYMASSQEEGTVRITENSFF